MTVLWILPPMILVVGAIGVARQLAHVSRGSDDLRAAVARLDDVRRSTKAVRSATESTRGSFRRLGRR